MEKQTKPIQHRNRHSSIIHRKLQESGKIIRKRRKLQTSSIQTKETVPKNTSFKKIQKTPVFKRKSLQVPKTRHKEGTLLDLEKEKRQKNLQNEKALYQTWYNLEILRYNKYLAECEDDIQDESENEDFDEVMIEQGDTTEGSTSAEESEEERKNSWTQ